MRLVLIQGERAAVYEDRTQLGVFDADWAQVGPEQIEELRVAPPQDDAPTE